MAAETIEAILNEWGAANARCREALHENVELGATAQIARSVLPNSTKTNITITANYREWRNYFRLRTASDAHPQIREVSVALLNELKERIPVIFDDIA